ncbi:MAG: hypothetical protein A2487_15185 [Candidatus Raymondbacteria bacterium RifOxyC12_full_50_8]|uniref:Photosynthesis system II assembly factor Ycf48/Hcf136-like domain-containing protein n=1 Tax=Candidatus Raymondbacteria bacterium RIFOXYD12_FULL_49_13 TaxID=1817890 RepID=A0A1F7FJU0_UNCRA|nr:MAG: hypothetical protein A2350_10575 [Candidatus Raymondbacteria bacterium RifOxyB12_full_50_8]OGJ91981.1 MAG: hypothetical protein A2248_09405 [Candidatus Raymondbacteria bacterium RIFOXYA2_FULL_49_16]OGJ96351.1 MAG: hypothetical protein A2453_08485 [Candidatus Raymondbacteria bacterium RIFOXYC2_FULL_50_21]OGK03714.1 MAG: hypothetical protein A2487_15185 [Candidatus Raymondbacteria bacterium RifOxyC12_full_50_8]OGK06888.1 MAG: hypothetical protein A2519_11555 [Candidatus Raymondbacteria ba
MCKIVFLIVAFFVLQPQGVPDHSYFYRNGFEPLTDVCFVNDQKGWACGASGAILYTVDGGQHWQYGNSNSIYFLEGIHFINEQTGFAIGGIKLPEADSYPSILFWDHSVHAMGVILRTQDGGLTWESQNADSHYPTVYTKPTAWLFDIDFIDSLNGWTCGSFGTIYHTSDGGATWLQQAYTGLNFQRKHGYWYYGIDFTDQNNGTVAGEDSLVATTSDGGNTWTYQKGPQMLVNTDVAPQPYEEGKLYNFFRGVFFINQQTGWAVGDNACLMKTTDGGATWAQQAISLPAELLDLVDIKDVFFIDPDTGWAVCHLGGGILRTLNGGQNWEWIKTGIHGWFNAVRFVDHLNGWAVGECGQIMRTSDGGLTWELQRGAPLNNGSYAPIMVVHAHGDDEAYYIGAMLARYGLDYGLPLVDVRTTKDCRGFELSRIGEVKRLEARTACSIEGNSGHRTFDEFDTDEDTSHAQEVAQWGGSEDLMMREIVEAIRNWRPAVIITHDSIYGEYNKQNHISTGKIATKAFWAAGDPLRFPELNQSAGLEEWDPKKLYFFSAGSGMPHFSMDINQTCARTGHTYAQQGTRALRNYVSQGMSGSSTSSINLPRMISTVTAPSSETDILAGTGVSIDGSGTLTKNHTWVLSAFPNPFNPKTKIIFDGTLSSPDQNIQITISDIHGKAIGKLTAHGRQFIEGVAWDASTRPSGVYFIKALVEGRRCVSRILVVK